MSKLKLYAADFDKTEVPKTDVKKKRKSKKDKVEEVQEELDAETVHKDLQETVPEETKVDNPAPSPQHVDPVEDVKDREPPKDESSVNDPPPWFKQFMDRTELLSQAPVPVPDPEPEPKPKRKRSVPKRIPPKVSEPKQKVHKKVTIATVEAPQNHVRDRQRAQIDHQFNEMNNLYNMIFRRK